MYSHIKNKFNCVQNFSRLYMNIIIIYKNRISLFQFFNSIQLLKAVIKQLHVSIHWNQKHDYNYLYNLFVCIGYRGCLKMFLRIHCIRNAFSHPTMTIETTTWLAAISILKVVVQCSFQRMCLCNVNFQLCRVGNNCCW